MKWLIDEQENKRQQDNEEKLEIAIKALKAIQASPFNITDEGIRIFHIADDALDTIEKIK